MPSSNSSASERESSVQSSSASSLISTNVSASETSTESHEAFPNVESSAPSNVSIATPARPTTVSGTVYQSDNLWSDPDSSISLISTTTTASSRSEATSSDLESHEAFPSAALVSILPTIMNEITLPRAAGPQLRAPAHLRDPRALLDYIRGCKTRIQPRIKPFNGN